MRQRQKGRNEPDCAKPQMPEKNEIGAGTEMTYLSFPMNTSLRSHGEWCAIRIEEVTVAYWNFQMQVLGNKMGKFL